VQVKLLSHKIGCGGGIMALDGKSGKTLWIQYTPHELFAPNCNLDINHDGIKDCVVGGRMAVCLPLFLMNAVINLLFVSLNVCLVSSGIQWCEWQFALVNPCLS
jgi:hypothetical protein